jgi:hypothetical protein
MFAGMGGQWFISVLPIERPIPLAGGTTMGSGDSKLESAQTSQVNGAFRKSLSDILDALGLDEGDLDWQDLAVCQGMPTNNFYDDYEADPQFAKVIDEACLSCPVLSQCLMAGTQNKEYGVWGSVYLNAGVADPNRNQHKTKEVWDRIKKRIEG